ncbi:MAG TPA: trypsin-like peptidase domain-containing protein [Gemmataceae bacterium]|jgi:predicted Zn finger-like uncharacterized protein|nr:trypsin-like peptidase domain-containing protein [Gemmataceae bacterium]
MAIDAVCPQCRAAYSLPDHQAGKKVRCKRCDNIFLVADPVPEVLPARPAQVTLRPQSRPPQTVTAARPAAPKAPAPVAAAPPARAVLPWAVGCVVACVGILMVGVITVVLLLRPKAPPEPVVAEKPVEPVILPPVVRPPVQPFNQPPPFNPLPQQPVAPPPVVQPDPPPPAPIAGNPAPAGEMSRAALAKVKKATVYIRVTMPDGSKASGSGFFGAADARNIVLTNAHVVGMLAPDSQRPRAVEVFLNSGEANEQKANATVLGVDRVTDLAVLDLGNAAGLPEPLTVRSAGGLTELDKVYIAGFPLGERLGKEITINRSEVSSLRKKRGVLDKIQLNGGMNPGNSGGPVVDGNGHVVGVAVSGIPGRQINFAIPGDRVPVILNGRISALGVGQPYLDNGNLGVPVRVEMIDPRRRIAGVALEVWAGDPPPGGNGGRPATAAPPPPQPGDSPHVRHELKYDPFTGVATGEVPLPAPKAGKVYWVQPVSTQTAGGQRWASANVHRLPSDPVERKPATLVMGRRNGSRLLTLTVTNTLRIGSGEDSEEVAAMRTRAQFVEQTLRATNQGAVLALTYRDARREIIEDKKSTPSKLLEQVRPFLPQVRALIQTDPYGNLTQNVLDPNSLRAAFNKAEELTQFHEPIRQALETMATPLPNKRVVSQERWRGVRALPIPTPKRQQQGQINMLYTYLGSRTRNGRAEAVLSVEGKVQGAPGKEKQFNGTASGTVLVDLTTGLVSTAEVKVTLDMELQVRDLGGPPPGGAVPETVRVRSTLVVRQERELGR